MNRWILPLGTFVAGAALGLAWQALRVDAPRESEAATDQPVQSPEPAMGATAAALAELQVIVDFQEAELQRLRDDLRESRRQTTAPLPSPVVSAPAPEGDDVPPEAPTRNRWVERMDARADERATEMADALSLTPTQLDALAAIYRDQMEAFRSRQAGNSEGYDLDGAVEGILTPEQFAAYIERSQEEIYNRAELMATTQTVRLSQSLPMAPEQQSQVYDILHLTAQEALISREVGETYDFRNAALERLRSILDAEQLQVAEETALRRWGRGP